MREIIEIALVTVATMFVLNLVAGMAGSGSSVHSLIKGF